MEFFVWLQNTALAQWVARSQSILAYPTILVLHTVGLALLVGGNVVIDFRLLGFGRKAPLADIGKLFPMMWVGLSINVISGSLLFIADAVHKASQWIFYAKLGFIVLALFTLRWIQPIVMGNEVVKTPAKGKFLATTSLLMWLGAISAGRLMAYLK